MTKKNCMGQESIGRNIDGQEGDIQVEDSPLNLIKMKCESFSMIVMCKSVVLMDGWMINGMNGEGGIKGHIDNDKNHPWKDI